jgi:hypothetical protein
MPRISGTTYPLTRPAMPVALAATPEPLATLTYSFDPTLPTAKDRVRDAIGDRDPAEWLRSNEEIEARLFQLADELLTVVVMAEGLAAEYARRIDSYSESGGVSVRWSKRVETWLEIAKAGRAQIAEATATGTTATINTAAIRVGPGGYDSEYVRGWTARNWFTE